MAAEASRGRNAGLKWSNPVKWSKAFVFTRSYLLMRNEIFLEVNKALTGASAVPNSEDTARVQICANSGENAEALSLKLLLTMALPITKIHLKRVINYSKKKF